MSRLTNLRYLAWFSPVSLGISGAAKVAEAAHVKDLVAAAQRVFGVRDRTLFLAAFFPGNAGYHYRCQRWAELLEQRGIVVDIRHVHDRETFYAETASGELERFHARALFVRLADCARALGYSRVIVRRELLLYNDYGDLCLDRLLLAIHPHVILDFDDDIRAAKKEPRPVSKFGRAMRESAAKFSTSLTLYSRFIAGSEYLASIARSARPDAEVTIVPTCVDYQQHAPKQYAVPEATQSDRRPRIRFGWIGSNGNLPLLSIVLPALGQLAAEHPIELCVISGQEYAADVPFPIVNIPWSLETQIDSLRTIDIGLMPLHDTPVERGKCGFKLIQYMGMGIVSVATGITFNNEVIEHGVNGFLVPTSASWIDILREAVCARERFAEIGALARETAEARYSFAAHVDAYEQLCR